MNAPVIIGDATLYLGDCLEILPTLDKGSIDAVVTDPPYGVGLRNGDVDGHRSDRWDSIIGDQNQEAGIAVLTWAEAVCVPTIAFSSPWKPWPGAWRNLIVWDKGDAVGGGGDIATCLKRTWELIHVARNRKMRGARIGSVWRYPITPQAVVVHICAKPVALMSALIDRFTDGAIIDPFMGSGSTGVACVTSGRKFVGIEIEERYFDIACRRIEAAQRQARMEFAPA